MKRQIGFTLIEMLVVVAIVGILMTMGWRMYAEQSRSNNRTDAIRATTAVALALTKFESDIGAYTWTTPPGAVTVANAHNRYLPQILVGPASDGSTNDITCSNRRGFRFSVPNNRYESCRGFYSIVVDIGPNVAAALGSGDATDVAYVITTTAIATGPQRLDLECNTFTLDSDAVKGHTAYPHPDRAPEPGDPLVDQPGANNSEGAWHSTRRCWSSD